MTIHIGRLTTEVTAAPTTPSGDASPTSTSTWAEQARLVALLTRAQRDVDRIATGDGRD